MSNADLWREVHKGAAYPLDLTEPPFLEEVEKKRLRSLTDICSHYIVQDAQMTLKATKVVPPVLTLNLLSAALLKNRDRAVYVLISRWPFESLCLKKLAPNLFTSVLSLYDNNHLNKMRMLGIRFTSTLAHYFAQSLKMKCSQMKLKYLDISGFVTVGVATDYLVSHCLLAYNEARQKLVLSSYNTLNQDTTAQYQADQSMPDGCYCVKLDLFVNSVNTHSELCKALVVSKSKINAFKLIVEKLDATFLGETKLKVLLELLDPVYLKALRLQFNSLGEHGILHIADSLSRHSNLTALDLSCNAIHFCNNQTSCSVMANCLASLPHLIRLDLSNNRIKTRLRQLLSNIAKSLEYLAVVGCCLTVSDLTYLALSHHMEKLQVLDLSENSAVAASMKALTDVVIKTADNLMVLELQDCSLNDSKVNDLLSVIPTTTCLQYLNLSGNDMCWETSRACVQTATKIFPLNALQISFPRECHIELSEENEDHFFSKTSFASQMRLLIQEEKLKTGFSFDLSLTES